MKPEFKALFSSGRLSESAAITDPNGIFQMLYKMPHVAEKVNELTVAIEAIGDTLNLAKEVMGRKRTPVFWSKFNQQDLKDILIFTAALMSILSPQLDPAFNALDKVLSREEKEALKKLMENSLNEFIHDHLARLEPHINYHDIFHPVESGLLGEMTETEERKKWLFKALFYIHDAVQRDIKTPGLNEIESAQLFAEKWIKIHQEMKDKIKDDMLLVGLEKTKKINALTKCQELGYFLAWGIVSGTTMYKDLGGKPTPIAILDLVLYTALQTPVENESNVAGAVTRRRSIPTVLTETKETEEKLSKPEGPWVTTWFDMLVAKLALIDSHVGALVPLIKQNETLSEGLPEVLINTGLAAGDVSPKGHEIYTNLNQKIDNAIDADPIIKGIICFTELARLKNQYKDYEQCLLNAIDENGHADWASVTIERQAQMQVTDKIALQRQTSRNERFLALGQNGRIAPEAAEIFNGAFKQVLFDDAENDAKKEINGVQGWNEATQAVRRKDNKRLEQLLQLKSKNALAHIGLPVGSTLLDIWINRLEMEKDFSEGQGTELYVACLQEQNKRLVEAGETVQSELPINYRWWLEHVKTIDVLREAYKKFDATERLELGKTLFYIMAQQPGTFSKELNEALSPGCIARTIQNMGKQLADLGSETRTTESSIAKSHAQLKLPSDDPIAELLQEIAQPTVQENKDSSLTTEELDKRKKLNEQYIQNLKNARLRQEQITQRRKSQLDKMHTSSASILAVSAGFPPQSKSKSEDGKPVEKPMLGLALRH